MELGDKWIYVVLVGVFAILIISVYFFTNQQTADTNLEECNTLIYNGPDKINLLFFSEKEEAQTYTEVLLKTEPLSKNNNQFNVFYLDSYDTKQDCELYKGIAILCYSKDLLKKAASCPNDFLIVLQKEDSKIRSSAYFNVMSINSVIPKTVLIHEFGHSFANLAEEYVPAKIPNGAKNCVDDCLDFGSDKEGCFQECSKQSYFRSIEAGVMRTLSSSKYGIFNEKIIEELILKGVNKESPLTGFAINEPIDCSDKRYYLIEAEQKTNSIQIKEKSLELGCAAGGTGVGELSFRYNLKDGTTTLPESINTELIFTDSVSEKTQELFGETYEQNSFLLSVPEQTRAESISFLDKGGNQITLATVNELGAEPCRIN